MRVLIVEDDPLNVESAKKVVGDAFGDEVE